jgi:hypothetical protein
MKTIVIHEKPGEPRREASLEIPAGWYRVLSGVVKPGDRHLNDELFWQTGDIEWCEFSSFLPPGGPYGTADWFSCLIRRGEPVDVLCPRCHSAPVGPGLRYCKPCSWNVAKEVHDKG